MDNQSSWDEIASVVKFHRQKSGLNRIELARLAGVGKTAVYDIEHGKQTVRLETLKKVLTALNISIEFKSTLVQVYKEEVNAKS